MDKVYEELLAVGEGMNLKPTVYRPFAGHAFLSRTKPRASLIIEQFSPNYVDEDPIRKMCDCNVVRGGGSS